MQELNIEVHISQTTWLVILGLLTNTDAWMFNIDATTDYLILMLG